MRCRSGAVQQQALLPTHADPKLWTVETRGGSAREACVKLMQKAINKAAAGEPLLIRSVFYQEHLKVRPDLCSRVSGPGICCIRNALRCSYCLQSCMLHMFSIDMQCVPPSRYCSMGSVLSVSRLSHKRENKKWLLRYGGCKIFDALCCRGTSMLRHTRRAM